MQSVVQLHLKSIRKDQLVGNNATSSNDAFVTDTEISRAAAKAGSGPRDLVQADSVWTSGGSDAALGDSLLSGSSHRGYNRSSSNDDLPINSRAAKLAGTTTPPIGLSSSSVKSSSAVLSGSIAGWDQFKANKELFNVTGGYDENVYTTPLDYSELDSAKIAHAEKLAREIESAPTQNIHQAEERGQVGQTDNSELDEEDKYSGVLPADRVQTSVAVTPAEPSTTSAATTTTATTGSKASSISASSAKPKLNYAQAAKQISSTKTTSVPPGFVAEKPPVKAKKEVKALEDTTVFKKETTPASVKTDEAAKDKTQKADKKIETEVPKSTESATASKSSDSFDVKKLSEAIDVVKTESVDASKTTESVDSKKKAESSSSKKPSEPSDAKKEPTGKEDAKKEDSENNEGPKADDKKSTAVDENKTETHDEESKKEEDTAEAINDATTEDIVAAAAAAKSKLNANAKEFTLSFSAKPFTPPSTMIQPQSQQPPHQVPPTQMALQPQHMHQQPHHPQFQPSYIDPMTGMPIQMHSAPPYGATAAHMQGHHGLMPGVHHMMGGHHMMGSNQPHHYPGQYQVMRGYPGQYIDPHAVPQSFTRPNHWSEWTMPAAYLPSLLVSE